ncbi:methyltransferase domain-containing protein [Polaribacter sp.]|uniref:methyltransferase domain-containing protein n=1 Tax=Polaribacter sp. TaxID=1920175 RepID=UPI003F6BD4B8
MNNSEVLIDKAIHGLSKKIRLLDCEDLLISDYNKRYLKEYKDNLDFFMPLYKTLLKKVIQNLQKPISESSFVDYGGGCGILTFLAVELGFKRVIYNDIYEVSTEDVKVISSAIGLKVDDFITGDIEQFINTIKSNNIKIDHICSFDVLEHIYNLEDWFKKIKEIQRPFSLCFMTSANSSNPYINYKLKKIHRQAEFMGSKRKKGWKERDSNLPFLKIREKIISENFKNINTEKINLLAKNTRGLFGEDILQEVAYQLKTSDFRSIEKHPTNTCDPLTGNWAEHIIDLKPLKNSIKDINTTVKFTNSFYSYSNNKILNFPKKIINFGMQVLGKENLFLSPSYTLEIQFKDK